MDSIYTNQAYLARHADWHASDSVWKYEQLRPLIAELPLRRVVDVGCGAGLILERLAADHPEAELEGFEITGDVERFWAERDLRIRFRRADFLAEQTPIYDLLLLIDVFEHVEDPYGFLRALRPRAVHHVFHIPLDMFALACLMGSYARKKASVGHLHYYDPMTARGLLEDCGYELLEVRLTRVYLQAQTRAARLLRWPRRLAELLLGAERNARWLGGYSMMVLARGADAPQAS